jgi:lysophospholipase L1-like esterase
MKWRFVIALMVFAPPGKMPGQTPDADRTHALDQQLQRQKRLIADWGGLIRYGSDDTELPPVRPGENRVVFFGDQITELWADSEPGLFGGKPWLSRGIPGQTSSQMLVRFRQDVVSIGAKAVLILAGTNDIAGVHGPSTEEMILDNLASMTDIAKAHGIRVILASLLPVCDCSGKTPVRLRWQERIEEANDLIRDYAARNGAIYADFYAALGRGRNMRADLSSDGVLPNRAGYDAMGPIAKRAIAEALRKPE